MRWLKYPQRLEKWVWPYFSTILNLDKAINTKAFKLSDKMNIEYRILVATDVYEMGIDNPDIKLVI